VISTLVVKRLSFLLSLFCVFVHRANAQTDHFINASSNATIINTVTGDRILDSGGIEDTYQKNENYTVTFCAENDSLIALYFSQWDVNYSTSIEIYEGTGTDGLKLDDIAYYDSAPVTIQSVSSCVTLKFVSSNWYDPRDGYIISVSAVSANDLIIQDGKNHTNVCSAVFYDSGGPSGDYTNNEGDNATTFCVEEGQYVLLEFTYLDIASSDELLIFDGADETATLLASLTNYSNDNASGVMAFQSSGACLTVVFNSNSYTLRDGWVANITCTDIASEMIRLDGNTYDACKGYLFDPGGLGFDYDNNASKLSNATTICAPPQEHVQLAIEHIDIATSDTLFIYDGADINAPLLGKLTNLTDLSTPGFNYHSYSNCLTIAFTSNNYTTGDGWIMSFSCVGYGPDAFINSGGSYQLCEGTFTDIGKSTYAYMKNESDNATTFCAASGDYMVMEFSYLDIASGDELAIYDGDNTSTNLLGILTNFSDDNGTSLIPFQSSGQCLTVEFTSNSTSQGDGWSASLYCSDEPSSIVIYDGAIHESCNGYLFDAGGMNNEYSNNESGNETTICSDNDEHIVLDFEYIDIERSDYLYIYDGQNTNGNLLATITDLEVSSAGMYVPFQSSGECLTLSFVSNGSYKADGWKAKYSCTAEDAPQFYTTDGEYYEVCDGYFIDEGGLDGEYLSNQTSQPSTFCAPVGQYLSLDFSYLEIGSGDTLKLYDGFDINAPVFATFTDKLAIGYGEEHFLPYQSSGQCLTAQLKSNNYTNGNWLAHIQCIDIPNQYASDYCQTAPMICNLNGYKGITSKAHTPDATGSEWNNISVDNNSWLKFEASDSKATFIFTVDDCLEGTEFIQVKIFEDNDCKSPRNGVSQNVEVHKSRGATQVEASGLIAGQIYKISIDGASGAVCSYTINADDGVELIDLNAGQDSTICIGDTVNVVGISSHNNIDFEWTWEDDNGSGSITGLTLTDNPMQTTQYTLTATGDGGCASVKDNMTIYVENCNLESCPASDVEISSCNSFDLTSLEADVTGSDNYQIDWGVANPSQYYGLNGEQIIITVSGESCLTDSATITLNKENAPTVFNGVYNLCGTGTADFDLESTQADIAPFDYSSAVFKWYTDTTLNQEILDIKSYNSTSDTVAVIVDVNGCNSMATLTLIVEELNVGSASLHICSDSLYGFFDLTSIESDIHQDSEGFEIQWALDVAGTDIIWQADNYYSAAGSVFAIVTDNQDECSAAVEVPLTIGSVEANDILIELCKNESTIDLAQYQQEINNQNGFFIEWFFDEARTIVIENINEYDADGASLYCIISDDDGVCTNEAEVTINIIDNPQLYNGVYVVCEGENGLGEFDLRSTYADIAPFDYMNANFYWYQDENLNFEIDDESIYLSPDKTLHVVVENEFCQSKATLDLVVTALDIANTSATSCDGEFNLEQLESNFDEQAQVNWYEDEDLSQVITNISAHEAIDNEVYAEVIVGNCKAISEVNLIVGQIQSVNTQLSACANANDSNNLQAIYDLSTLDTIVNAGTINTVEYYHDSSLSQLITNPKTFLSSEKIIYAKVFSSQDCYAIAKVSLLINGMLEVNNVELSIADNGNGLGTIDLIAQSNLISSDFDQIIFYYDADLTLLIEQPSIFTTAAGVFYAQVSNDEDCSAIATLNIIIIEQEDDSGSEDDNLDTINTVMELNNAYLISCDSAGYGRYDLNKVELQVLNGNQGSLFWSYDISNNVPVVSKSNLVTQEAFVFAHLENSNNNAKVYLTKHDAIDLKIEPEALILEEGDIVSLVTNQPDLEHLWTPAIGLDDSNSFEPYLTAVQNQVYFLHVWDEFGCKAFDTLSVRIIEAKEKLQAVAEIFSPNGDGDNDELSINAEGACQIDFRIYDRWGKELFTSNNTYVNWDGTYRGIPVASDSYLYIMKVRYCGDEKVYSFQGEITLVK